MKISISIMVVLAMLFSIGAFAQVENTKLVEKVDKRSGLGWIYPSTLKIKSGFSTAYLSGNIFTQHPSVISVDVGGKITGSYRGPQEYFLQVDAIYSEKVVIGIYSLRSAGTRSAYSKSNRVEMEIDRPVYIGNGTTVAAGPTILEITLVKISGPTATFSVQAVK